jgi:hypothetical protein
LVLVRFQWLLATIWNPYQYHGLGDKQGIPNETTFTRDIEPIALETGQYLSVSHAKVLAKRAKAGNAGRARRKIGRVDIDLET